MSLLRFPWLFPIRNSSELRVLYCHSYFGPRTCGGGITNVIEVGGALNQGFPLSPLNVHFCVQPQAQRYSIPSTRGVPFHLPDALERHQLRMASNGIAMSTFVLSPKHKGALYRPLVVGYNAGRAGGERQQVGGHTTHDARTQH